MPKFMQDGVVFEADEHGFLQSKASALSESGEALWTDNINEDFTDWMRRYQYECKPVKAVEDGIDFHYQPLDFWYKPRSIHSAFQEIFLNSGSICLEYKPLYVVQSMPWVPPGSIDESVPIRWDFSSNYPYELILFRQSSTTFLVGPGQNCDGNNSKPFLKIEESYRVNEAILAKTGSLNLYAEKNSQETVDWIPERPRVFIPQTSSSPIPTNVSL